MKEAETFKTASGRCPFQEWVEDLDVETRRRIFIYIDRVCAGAAKKSIKPVGSGVFEIKIDTGPGYRVYFGEAGRTLIILLLGGDKHSQKADIRRAVEYWENYAKS